MKNSPNQQTAHHRKPRSKGGEDTIGNISIVKRKFHEAYHLLFADKSPVEVAKMLTDIWVDPQWEIVAKMRHPKN